MSWQIYFRVVLTVLIVLLLTGSAMSETRDYVHPASYINENPEKIEFTEENWITVKQNTNVDIEFYENNIITNVKFRGREYGGHVTSRVTLISRESSLVDSPPNGILYQYVAINVGDFNWIKNDPIDRQHIGFKINKSWIAKQGYKKSSITLFRFKKPITILDLQGNITNENEGEWEALTTRQIDEDANYRYFDSATSTFDSVFAITINDADKTRIDEKVKEPIDDSIDSIDNKTNVTTDLFLYETSQKTSSIQTKSTVTTDLIPTRDILLFVLGLIMGFVPLFLLISWYLIRREMT